MPRLTPRRAAGLVAAACVLPRLALLLKERESVVENVEKSKDLALTFVQSGTFGYVPGYPSAYTQPLYGWFLTPITWITGLKWWSLGGAQIVVATATALVVLEIGRRTISLRVGLLAALIATLHPYLIWHDIHGNREILDQLLGAGMFGLVLVASRKGIGHLERLTAVLGLLVGVAILSNTRLLLLPLALAVFLVRGGMRWQVAAILPVVAALTIAPWVVRNKAQVGCFSITTDARALWKANNAGTYATLANGGWIDQVPDIPERSSGPIPEKWLTPQEIGEDYRKNGVLHVVDECWQMRQYEHRVFAFWEHHPGEKARLALQATGMLWNPRVGSENSVANVGGGRNLIEPLWMIPVCLLALAGLFLVERRLRTLSLIFLGYETVAAWVFAGTTRYRVPWDFVLALLAAATLARLWDRFGRRPKDA